MGVGDRQEETVQGAVRKWGFRKLCLLMLESLRRLHPTTSDRLQPLPSYGNHAHPSHHLFKKKKERKKEGGKGKKKHCKVSGAARLHFFLFFTKFAPSKTYLDTCKALFLMYFVGFT